MLAVIKKYILPLVLIIVVNGSLTAAASAQQSGLATMSLKVESKSGSHVFLVELATTIEQQATGMMYRNNLDPDKGMFFIYNEPDRRGFWMKNTLIPLDIIYIRADGRIANIIRSAKPHDETSRRSRGPILAVLELAGGRAKELGIRPGDRVMHNIFKNSDSK